jgi:hypothetical protein
MAHLFVTFGVVVGELMRLRCRVKRMKGQERRDNVELLVLQRFDPPVVVIRYPGSISRKQHVSCLPQLAPFLNAKNFNF